MPEKKRKTDHHDGSHKVHDDSAAQKKDTGIHSGREDKKTEHASGSDKHRHLPLRSHKDGICEVKLLPEGCEKIYRTDSLAVYKNDQQKSFFVEAEDYHTQNTGVPLKVFGHAAGDHARAGGNIETPVGKYYCGVCWSIILEGRLEKIVFMVDDYHSKYLKIPFAEMNKIFDRF